MPRFGPSFLALVALSGCVGSSAGDTAAAEPAVVQPDSDGDTIIDIHEGAGDTDGDGTPDFEDEDSDGDSILDVIEAGDDDPSTLPVDSDGDGVPDYVDTDSDGNCVSDALEAGRSDGDAVDSDLDGVADFQDPDNDGDGILDRYELQGCEAVDTDGDSIPDYLDSDSDGDGIGDTFESGVTDFSNTPVDTDGDGVPDFLDLDSDNDGLLDSIEGGTGGDATVEPHDTDSDGQYDFADVDADGDSLLDATELALGTDPYDPDTDGDGFTDGGEVTAGTDPLDPSSVIEGIYVVVPERTRVEENFEFELKPGKGDVVFVVSTQLNSAYILPAFKNESAQLTEELSEVLPDLALGVGGHDDYAYSRFGRPEYGDLPFYLRQQVTTDVGVVQSAIDSLELHNGDDGTGSGFEALYQAASGAGYDQDCDRAFEATTDVLPFLSAKDDPFGGAAGQHYDESTIGGGIIGGFGFREYALPIIVLATSHHLRDPEAAEGEGWYRESPGGCPIDAARSDAVRAFSDIGAYFIGVAHEEESYSDMISFAQATASYADLDGDGVAREETVLGWNGSDAEFRETVVELIRALVGSLRFSRVDLVVEGDDYGLVTAIDPPYYEGLETGDSGRTLTFTLTFLGTVAATREDQLYKLTLNVLGDSTVLLATLDIIVKVPGSAF